METQRAKRAAALVPALEHIAEDEDEDASGADPGPTEEPADNLCGPDDLPPPPPAHGIFA